MRQAALLGLAPSAEHVEKVIRFIGLLAEADVDIVVDEELLSKLLASGELLRELISFTGTVPATADYVVCFGGDGTLLRSVHRLPSLDVPVLTVNSGHLGFLTDSNCDEAIRYIDRLLVDNPSIEERNLLEVTDGGAFFTTALNEIAVQKRETGSMISIQTNIDDHYLGDYNADGLIIATPSGSTAYSLSVGGPIVYPRCPVVVLTPIAPHSLNMRPIVVPDDVTIRLRIKSRSSTYMAAVDGVMSVFTTDTPLTIRKHTQKLKIIRLSSHPFSETIRNKLLWGKNLR